ncbi:STAS domain-containing protein [Georgenia ruanii]|uniref:STAS domain-containing protein n=1 Tax=Georgenia ruanii TaxID=348442 RepID=A0A7J9UT88_9MICO|nr:STAS domain-containing protein [Georgenia ruanii]MPV87837.1 STAS domain-containing protein [Georgenia ruanii]
MSTTGTSSTPANETRTPGSVSVLRTRARTRLVLAGDVDISLNATLNDAVELAVGLGRPVDVDTADVTFMDSAVVAMLARLAYRVPDRLRMLRPPDLVRFLLDVTQLGEIVDILDEDPDEPVTTHRPPAA